MGGFSATPAFELFSRGLTSSTVRQFRGINKWASAAALPGNYASDCLNCIVSGSGALEKMRLPVDLTAALDPSYGQTTGPGSFWEFETGLGVKQVLAFFGAQVWLFTNDFATQTLIDNNPLNVGQWSMVESNNVLYGVNGQRAQYWDGTNWFKWGMDAPAAAPTIGGAASFLIHDMTRLAGVVTANMQDGPILFSLINLQVGDVAVISSIADPTFDGTIQITNVLTPGVSYQWNQGGANAGPVAGLLRAPFSSLVFAIDAAPTGAVRLNGTSFIHFTPAPLDSHLRVPDTVTITGVTDVSFNGTFPVASIDYTTNPAVLQILQPGEPDAQSGAGQVAFGITTDGTMWAYAYGNDKGGVSNMSPASPSSGALVGATAYLHAVPPTDPQVTKIYWFRTLSGGSDFFLDDVTTDLVNGNFTDDTPDENLNLQIRGPLINNPAPLGKYICLWLGRIVMGNIPPNPGLVQYSGYEQILLGRPEESWPPKNGFQLQIGAQSIQGLGALQAGVVILSNVNRAWMIRGSLEDITLAAPIQFSAFLEEMPWNLGCASHFTVQSTSHGLLWLAADRTMRVFTGSGEPADLSNAIYPILRRITPGTEFQCNAAYFNWLERDWYCMTCCLDGSGTPNTLIFWDDETDTADNVGVFISDVQADFVATLTRNNVRILCISQGGKIKRLPVSSETVSGVTSPITSTSGAMNAFWRSGYFGNDSIQRNKMWRKALVVADNQGFKVKPRYVDMMLRTFRVPEVGRVVEVNNQGFAGLNRKANMCSTEIIFPAQDVSCSVLALSVEGIPTSDR